MRRLIGNQLVTSRGFRAAESDCLSSLHRQHHHYCQPQLYEKTKSEKVTLYRPRRIVGLAYSSGRYILWCSQHFASLLMCSAWIRYPCLNVVYSFGAYSLSSPRTKRAGLKGLHAESAWAVTGRRCPHSGEGEDFLTGQLDLFTKTAVTPERKVEKSIPRWEINRHAEG